MSSWSVLRPRPRRYAGGVAEPNHRFLIVPDDQLTPDTALRARRSSGTTREGAGRSIRPPEVVATARPAGEIRPTLSGWPEEHVVGASAGLWRGGGSCSLDA